MNSLEKYNIYISNLPENKEMEYQYTLNEDFFSEFSFSDFSNGNFEIIAKILKKNKDITIKLQGMGSILVNCDRCLSKFPIEIDINETFYLKQSDEEIKDSEIITIKEKKNIFNIAELIYQTIVFLIPLRRVHPLDESENPTCNKEMIEKLNKYIIN